MNQKLIVGYDPGGNGSNGFATLKFNNKGIIGIETETLKTSECVINKLASLACIDALGVDTLTCWCTGQSGWRPADTHLRAKYRTVMNSVKSPNSLRGSMIINGMSTLIAARQMSPDLIITETHPKVLYYALSSARYDYEQSKQVMDNFLSTQLGSLQVSIGNEHEWDAALSALAAYKGYLGSWRQDLHALGVNAPARYIKPCGTTHFYWPQDDPIAQ